MYNKQRQSTIPKTSSQNLTMTKQRRYSKTLETTIFLFDSFRPLATSTPYEINANSSRHQRPFLTPPIFCSTPKQTRRQPMISSVKRKLPVVISQRRLQFTTNSNNNNESKRMTIKNIKIWLL